jgi:flagellar hook-basal body complex protein FliE
MTVSQLQRLRQTGMGDGRLPVPQSQPGGTSFGETLKDAIGKVDASQNAANEQIEAFVAGETDDLHEVMISMNQAKLTFQLMTEVRNRAMETYQELMRMQV